jgi:hypothetical protein
MNEPGYLAKQHSKCGVFNTRSTYPETNLKFDQILLYVIYISITYSILAR